MICNENDFKASVYGQSKIQSMVKNLSTKLRPVFSGNFNIVFLKAFYQDYCQNNNIAMDIVLFNCYERLLDFWAHEKYLSIKNDYETNQIAKEIALFNKTHKTFDPFGWIQDNLTIVLGIVIAATVYNFTKK